MTRPTQSLSSLLIALLLLPLLSGCSGGQLVNNVRAQLQRPSARYTSEGDRLAADGRTAEAILAYRQAVIQDGRNVEALRKLAQVYAGQGRRRLALQVLAKAAALAPNDAEVARAMADLRAASGENSPAQAPVADGDARWSSHGI